MLGAAAGRAGCSELPLPPLQRDPPPPGAIPNPRNEPGRAGRLRALPAPPAAAGASGCGDARSWEADPKLPARSQCWWH